MTRIDPTALRINSICVEGFRPIGKLGIEFDDHNVITGMNGVGKTSLLHLMAGIAGNDAATDLVADEKIGFVHINLMAGNRQYDFTATERLDRDSIREFKASLPDDKRVNYALSEFYYEKFQHGCCDYDTFHASLKHFLARSGHNPMVFKQLGVGARMDLGSGVTQAFRLLFLAAMRGGPLLLDHPELSLDSRNQSIMSRMIPSSEKQTIVVTHAIEWGRGDLHHIEISR